MKENNLLEIYLLHKLKLSSLSIIFKHGGLLVTFVFILQMGKWKEIPQGVIKTCKLISKNYVTMQSGPVLSQLDHHHPPPPSIDLLSAVLVHNNNKL